MMKINLKYVGNSCGTQFFESSSVFVCSASYAYSCLSGTVAEQVDNVHRL